MTFWLIALFASLAVGMAAEAPPALEIGNGLIRARLCPPDPQRGFYRGTRFDWSGVINGLQFAGHDFFPQWFQRMDPTVHDFVYAGPDIVAGPCTAITGPSEEFAQPLGFDQAKPGETFIKIGVGVLRRPDAGKYDMFHLYEIVDGGTWTNRSSPAAAEFTQRLSDPRSGYAYEYRKTVAVAPRRAELILEHSFRNTGSRPIQTSVYNHNFLYVDQQAPGSGVSLSFPFPIRTEPPPDPKLVQVKDRQLSFLKTLQGEERVYTVISGFSANPKDYQIRVENRSLKVAVKITGNRPLSRLALWSIRAPLSIEPFIDLNVEPGAEFTWQIRYDFSRI
jgi:hypothetical protein